MNWFLHLREVKKLQVQELKNIVFQYFFTICKINLSRDRHSGIACPELDSGTRTHQLLKMTIMNNGLVFSIQAMSP